jgi:hypothetical protein
MSVTYASSWYMTLMSYASSWYMTCLPYASSWHMSFALCVLHLTCYTHHMITVNRYQRAYILSNICVHVFISRINYMSCARVIIYTHHIILLHAMCHLVTTDLCAVARNDVCCCTQRNLLRSGVANTGTASTPRHVRFKKLLKPSTKNTHTCGHAWTCPYEGCICVYHL